MKNEILTALKAAKTTATVSADESMSAKELAELLGVTPATIRRHAKKMTDEGLITATLKETYVPIRHQFGGNAFGSGVSNALRRWYEYEATI